MILKMKKSVLVSLVLGLTTMSHAHHIWLEQHTDHAALYFGEFGQNLREVSPGVLDKLTNPKATKVTVGEPDQVFDLSKLTNAYHAQVKLAEDSSLLVTDPDYAVFERKQGEQVIRGQYVPAARLLGSLQKQQPKLKLDIVPTGQTSANTAEFQVWFNQQPLPNVEVDLWTASGWKQTLRTDQDGKLTAAVPWQTVYVLELNHKEQIAGQKNGQPYDHSSYTTAVTFYQKQGLAQLPAKPAAPPN